MSRHTTKTFGFILLLALLHACGGGGGSGTDNGSEGNGNTGDNGGGQPPASNSICGTGDLCIFENELASTWTMAVYEQVADQTTYGNSGTTDNSTWSIVDSGDEQRGNVIDVTLFQSSGYADFSFQPILANSIDSAGTQTIDLSSYVEDELVFDYRIVNWEDNEIGLFMNMQCGWPCRSQFFPVANQTGTNFIAPPDLPIVSTEGEWREARVPMHYFIRDNLSESDPWLELNRVNVLSIAPPWESEEAQRNVRYQIDNLRIEKSQQTQNSNEPPFNFFMFENTAVAVASISSPENPVVELSGSIDEVNGDIFLVVDISESNVVIGADVAIDESTQMGTVFLTLNQAANLGEGPHSQVVTIRACRDANCAQEYRGSPQRVNIHYSVP